MKSMWPPLAAIFYMTYSHRAGGGGGMAPHPPWFRYCLPKWLQLRKKNVYKNFVIEFAKFLKNNQGKSNESFVLVATTYETLFYKVTVRYNEVSCADCYYIFLISLCY